MNYLLDNNLNIGNKQYGFIRGRSTMLQLLHMLADWTDCLEKGGQIDMLYIVTLRKSLVKYPTKD